MNILSVSRQSCCFSLYNFVLLRFGQVVIERIKASYPFKTSLDRVRRVSTRFSKLHPSSLSLSLDESSNAAKNFTCEQRKLLLGYLERLDLDSTLRGQLSMHDKHIHELINSIMTPELFTKCRRIHMIKLN